MVSDLWRAFLRTQRDILRIARKQSKAFAEGHNLSLVPLRFGTKEFMTTTERAGEFAHWDDFDALPQANWAAKFPPVTPTRAEVDVDIDIKPVDGEWTPERERDAAELLHHIIDIAIAVGGWDGRFRWGRKSLDCDGHVFLAVAYVGKNEKKRLDGLSMRQPIVIGDFKVRFEVRGHAPNKAFTLPGSIYHDRNGYDLIGWRHQLPDNDIPSVFPTLQALPLASLTRGLWAGLLAASLSPFWGDGARHELAREVSGVLAREVLAEGDRWVTVDEAQAREIMERLCLMFADDEMSDRLRVLEDSLNGMRTGRRNITGYSRLAETIGNPAREALLRYRGGGDPDAMAALLERIAYVPFAMGFKGVWLDLAQRNRLSIICDRSTIINHYHPRPDYPTVNGIRRPIPMIELALASNQLQRYDEAVDLPGVPFGMVLVPRYGTFEPAAPEEIADINLSKAINIGPGWATAEVETPDLRALTHFKLLWARHLHHVCCGNKQMIDEVNRVIAWAVRWPIDKVPRGLCFTGDGGIGKSATFDLILAPILGRHVIAKINALNLEGQFRLDNLEGTKFYCIEEINLGVADVATKELLKDLMKNERIRVNRKYGAQSDVHNFAFPIFLTNERDPVLTIHGQEERSLIVIQGETRERLRMNKQQWGEHRKQIHQQTVEFVGALKKQEVREAALYYFQSEIDVERYHFDDANSSLTYTTNARLSAEPIDEALANILENNRLTNQMRQPLTAPFKIEWLLEGVAEQLKMRNSYRGQLIKQNISRRLNTILDGHLDDLKFRHSDGKTYRLKYINIRYGEMLRHASDVLGFDLVPAYELDPVEDFGENAPSAADAQRMWESPFSFGTTI